MYLTIMEPADLGAPTAARCWCHGRARRLRPATAHNAAHLPLRRRRSCAAAALRRKASSFTKRYAVKVRPLPLL